MPHREPIHRLTIRAALVLGFGLTLLIWLVAGYYFTKRIRDTATRAAEVNARYMRAQDLLSTVRAQVLLGSVYVRDALLDPRPATDEYRRKMEETYDAVSRALQQYVPVLDSSSERERVSRLHNEIEDARATMLQVLATDRTRWVADARVILRTQVVPKREAVIRMSEEVQALNRNAFVQQQEQVTEIYSAAQRGLWQSLGLALAASLGVALLAVLYASRLEGRLQEQRIAVEQNAGELQKLSARLISAQEEERRSIARELHDEVGQLLTTIKVELTVAQRSLEASGGNAELLGDVRNITDGAVATVRDLSHLLHPALLDDLGLAAAVEWFLRGFSRRHDIHAEVLHDHMEERLPLELEASAYRIVQEALNNVVKHARATTCRVYLQRLPTTLLVTVEDDGAGFDEAEVSRAGARAGLGLIGIRERAKQLRGTVRVESAPGRGTRLTVELPVRPSSPRTDDSDRASVLTDPVTLNG